MGSNSSSGGGGGGGGNQQAKARRLMTTTPNYSKPKTKSVTAGTLSDPREKDDTAAKMDLFRNQGATNIKNTPMVGAGAILKPAFQAGSKITRDYFTEKVLGKGGYKGTTKGNFEKMSRSAQESMYKGYITGRTSGKTDAMGREIISTGSGGENQVVQAPEVTAPTTAEVSQVTTTVAETPKTKEDNILLRKRKAKAKGRSPTILTGVTGVTGSLTLGKPSLLGR
tara:strand:+ start:7 stop:681 length:675 start_codon:yes stop_codon:yes gene_type:complete